MRKTFTFALILLLAGSLAFAAAAQGDPERPDRGSDPRTPCRLLEPDRPDARQQGITLKVVEFTD
jgi:ABC-type metal ion transport system substrate-binding protein